jgi:predicted alpha-1,2-mannosidase
MPRLTFARSLYRRRSLATAFLGAILCSASVFAQARSQALDLTKDVYPFLGVDWGGNTFVGAALPFGMMKVGPDMEDFDGHTSKFGYISGGRILGFSHLHLSGAAGKYGNILVAPVTGPLDPSDIGSPRTDEVAHPGYYAATLTRYATRVELTASRRVALHRYTFPASDQSHLTLNLDRCLNKGTGWEDQKFLGGELHILSDHEAEGMGRYTGGWNRGGEYRVYFYLVLDTPSVTQRIWTGKALTDIRNASLESDQRFGLSFNFHTKAGQAIQAKVAISFISTAQARESLQQETPGWNFNAVRQASIAAWNRALSPMQVRGATSEQRREFYTALYHTMLMPSDRTGENPVWQSSEPYYDDFQAIWDTFRSSGPLLTLIAPDRQRDMLRSLIDTYRHTGYMPDARVGNDNGRTQGGSNANILIADAYVKGMTGIDYPTAFAAMLKDAEVPPEDSQKEGRGGLRDYNTRGYVTLADQRSGSRTVEYSYDDFAIAEVACGLHRNKEAKLYAARSSNWQNLWDKDLANDGFTGFLRPRNPDGSWAAPNTLVRGTWPDFFYEGDLWTYSLYAPHDVRKLIELAGGKENFVRRLDRLFLHQHFDVTNEPGFLLPVLYDWAGRPDHTADVIRAYLDKYFTARRSGIPGNDDSGAMSSWFLFQSIGFYPNAGQDIYLIGTPSYPEVDITVAPGKVFRIIADNLDSEQINRYVQSASLNGQPLTASWFRHSQIKSGGTLILHMGSAPSTWGTDNPPPSMSDAVSPLCPGARLAQP